MPALPRIGLFSFLLLVSVFLGCGGSPSRPTPQGSFTNSVLNGTYAISFSGSDGLGFFAVAGSIQADGAGHITSGVLDITRLPQPATNVAVTGTYNIRADGRGVATLNTAAQNFSLAFAVVSTQRALVSRFEASATGSGSMDLENSAAFSTAALAGTFVFNLSGADGAQNPFATVGSITTNAGGTVTAGVQDLADNGTITTAQAISAGTLTMAANGRGSLNVVTTAGTLNFAVYVVDGNHLKLVEIDSQPGPALAGDAFRQQGPVSNASFSGPFAFTVAGSDVSSGPLVAGGLLAPDGAGGLSSGTEDINIAGSFGTGFALTGSYALGANGRGTLTFNNATVGTSTFAIYPTTNGVQMLEIDPLFTVSGSALAQTGAFSNASISGAYAMNFTGASPSGPFDSVASLKADGAGHFNGIIDINNTGSVASGNSMFGSYSIDASGRGPMTLNSPLGPQSLAVYTINSTRAIFIEVDANLITVGEMEHQ